MEILTLVLICVIVQGIVIQICLSKIKSLSEDLKWTIVLCENEGDFSNGVRYNGMDEGQVMASRMLNEVKKRHKIGSYDG